MRTLPDNCLPVSEGGSLCTSLCRDAVFVAIQEAEKLRLAYQQTAIVCSIARENYIRIQQLHETAVILGQMLHKRCYGDSDRWSAALAVERLLGAMACEHPSVIEESAHELLAIYYSPSNASAVERSRFDRLRPAGIPPR